MTYTRNNPQPDQSLGQTQPTFVTNGNLIDDTISQDHVSMSILGQGKHNWVTLVNPIPSIPNTLVNEVLLYKDTRNILTLRQQNGTNLNDMFLAFGNLSVADLLLFGENPQGWTTLPGYKQTLPLTLNYGSVSGPGASGTITFNRTFANAFIMGLITPSGNSGNVGVSINNTGGHQPTQTKMEYLISGVANVSKLYWIAIGF